MPVVALRNMAVLPGMLVHFDVNRKKSIAAIEQAMHDDQMIFLVAQKDMRVDEPTVDDLYQVGCISQVKQIIKLPGGLIRVMIVGTKRGELDYLAGVSPYLSGQISVAEEEVMEQLTVLEQTAMLETLREILEVYITENNKIGKDIVKQLMAVDTIDKLLVQIPASIPLAMEHKQRLLEAKTIAERFAVMSVILSNEAEVFRIRKELQGKVKERVDKNQKEYILREQLKVIREELGESGDADKFLEQLEELQASEEVKEAIHKEIERYKNLGGASAEGAVSRTYIETLLSMPWDKKSEDNESIKRAETILNRDHYGLEKVKERVLEFLAVRALTKKGQSPIVCLVGPPGTGKTSIARSVAEALNKKYVRICLGGVRDESEIRGHRRTYIGAMPGRIATGIKTAGVKNPLMLLDEIDKVSSDFKGDPSAALLEVLDPEQNVRFVDHYIEQAIDLSEVLFIATANSLQPIPKPLLDRMEVIEVSSYTENEKFHIAKDYLVKKQLAKNGLTTKDLRIAPKALRLMITGYTKEAGVRNLERKIGEVCRKAAKQILDQREEKAQEETPAQPIKVTDKNLSTYLGKVKYRPDKANETAEVGIVRGLAWTSVGGDTLQIEVNTMSGKGVMKLTGQLGDVMKESAEAALSYVRSVCERDGVAEDYFEKHDLHIHIPEGAVPKDGPSAGITMATAMYSAVTGIPVNPLVAMTGEITLRGRVLPIGGLKEKLLAAKLAGMKKVLVPVENESDVKEISEEILDGLCIVYMKTMNDVLKEALER